MTNNAGAFDIPVTSAPPNPARLKFGYDGPIPAVAGGTAGRLLVMDDLHNARSDELEWPGTVAGGVLDLGVIVLDSADCALWRIGSNILRDYQSVSGLAPPTGQFRIKRWNGVVVGAPHTFYDYVVLRTDFVTDHNTAAAREGVLFHEFGHSLRHVFDGDEAHWHLDNFRWRYGRDHKGAEITSMPFAFNEGWANYWSRARRFARAPYVSPLTPNNLYWNEQLVANRLLNLSTLPGVNDGVMANVLETNRGQIHSLYDFEVKLFTRLSINPPPPPSPCPPGWTDTEVTCYRDPDTIPKPSYSRGVGTVPNSCPPGQEYDAGLCYPICNPGFHGVGPVCWGTCPEGWDDHGATCYKFPNVSLKPSYGRGVGTVPKSCPPGQEYDAGLCYPPCKPGDRGIGPVCWSSCPPGYEDHGATCYRPATIDRY